MYRFALGAFCAASCLSAAATTDVLFRDGSLSPDGSRAYNNSFNADLAIAGNHVVATAQVLGDGVLPAAEMVVTASCARTGSTVVTERDVLPSTNILREMRGNGGPVLNAGGTIGMLVRGTLASNANATRFEMLLGSAAGVQATALTEGDSDLSGDGLVFPRNGVSSAINAFGQLAYPASLFDGVVTSSDDEAIYRWNPATGTNTQIVRKGDLMPNGDGTLTGTAFQSNDVFFSPFISDAGEVVFVGDVLGGSSPGSAIMIGDGQQLTKVIRTGEALPGGESFSFPWGYDVDSAGNIGFTVNWQFSSSSPDAVYVLSDDTLSVVARSGQFAPGGGTFRTLGRAVKLAGPETAVFESSITDNGIDDGLYIGDSSSVTQLLRLDDPAPNGYGTYTNILEFTASEAGWVAYRVRTTLGEAIYRYSAATGIEEVHRLGETFDGGNITELRLGGDQFTQASGVNDRGDILFAYRLDTGITGIALAEGPDSSDDGDGVNSGCDNCTLLPNPSQLDADGDGYGNACDADFNQDCVVNVVDLGFMRSVFFTPNAEADLNGDGVVNVIDLGILRTLFFSAPGPSPLGTCDN